MPDLIPVTVDPPSPVVENSIRTHLTPEQTQALLAPFLAAFDFAGEKVPNSTNVLGLTASVFAEGNSTLIIRFSVNA